MAGGGRAAIPDARPVIPALVFVIPAKAGIHTPPLVTPGLPGFWIPACAGMTAAGRKSLKSPPFAKGGLGGFIPILHSEQPTTRRWRRTPAAGRVSAGRVSAGARPGLRTADESPQPPFCERGAFGGKPSAPTVIPSRPTVIPAQAGIQNPGLSRPTRRPGCGFPLSRE